VEGQKRTRIVRDEVRYTTLERSVEGLTGGKPVALSIFENRISSKAVATNPLHESLDKVSLKGSADDA